MICVPACGSAVLCWHVSGPSGPSAHLRCEGAVTPLPGALVGYDAGSLSKLPRPALQEPGVERAAATCPTSPSPGGARSPRRSGSGQLLGSRSSALWRSARVVTCRVSRVACRRRWLPPARAGPRIQDDARDVQETEPGPRGAWPRGPPALAELAAAPTVAAWVAWCPPCRGAACPARLPGGFGRKPSPAMSVTSQGRGRRSRAPGPGLRGRPRAPLPWALRPPGAAGWPSTQSVFIRQQRDSMGFYGFVWRLFSLLGLYILQCGRRRVLKLSD